MMRTLLAWVLVVVVFSYSYLGSFAYFSDSSSIRLSLKIEDPSIQIGSENLMLVRCHCSCNYLLRGIVLNATGSPNLEGIYFRAWGWAVVKAIVDNSSFPAKTPSYVPLNVTLTPGLHNVSLVLRPLGHCGSGRVMYLVFYANGEGYPLSVTLGRCRR
ncbi:hypothetical protein [Thermococcus sp.]|uniref:hypothetical protein n=1 Tax=Thermococcus sp. TaxID=35749 RepID=UPI0026191787|nr:hypothetical protein [Thermococcus sp.]